MARVLIFSQADEYSCAFYSLPYGKLKALTRKMAIWSRVNGVVGQYIIGLALQPEVIPSAANCSIQSAAQ